MPPFNTAYRRTLLAGRLTLGLMTPVARANGAMADPEAEREVAALADRLGFAALWTRDVPVMVPQGEEISVLDEPFVWLAMLAGATRRIALGTAAAVLPLRHPLHVAKAALSLNRLSGERFILGLGSGDREAEFAIFRQDIALRGDAFRERWNLVRSALSPDEAGRAAMREAAGGHDLMAPPDERIGMLVVGSARQSLQWTAANRARPAHRARRAGGLSRPHGRRRRGACADERGARPPARHGGGRGTGARGVAAAARPRTHAGGLTRAESGACSFREPKDTIHDRSLELPHHEEMARAAP